MRMEAVGVFNVLQTAVVYQGFRPRTGHPYYKVVVMIIIKNPEDFRVRDVKINQYYLEDFCILLAIYTRSICISTVVVNNIFPSIVSAGWSINFHPG